MPDFKELAKGGWHPKGKDGNSESWRGDFKGLNQVAGWVGKGKEPTVPAAERTSRPLSTLKDPASFGPPPKHINYHGGAALPTQVSVFPTAAVLRSNDLDYPRYKWPWSAIDARRDTSTGGSTRRTATKERRDRKKTQTPSCSLPDRYNRPVNISSPSTSKTKRWR